MLLIQDLILEAFKNWPISIWTYSIFNLGIMSSEWQYRFALAFLSLADCLERSLHGFLIGDAEQHIAMPFECVGRLLKP